MARSITGSTHCCRISPSSPSFPAPAAELRVQAALLFAFSYQRPRADLVETCLARMRVLLQSPGGCRSTHAWTLPR